jgi:hypothetical protein
MPSKNLPLTGVLIALAFLQAACDRGAEPSPGDHGQHAAADASSSNDTIALPVAPIPLPDWAEDNIKRADPAYDRWPSEVKHDHAKKVLAGFLKLVTGEVEWTDENLAGVLAPEFHGVVELRPEDLETVFEDGGTRVQRPNGSLSEELHSAGELRAVVERLRKPFDEGRCKSFMKIVRVHLEEGDHFRTKALVHLDGASEGGLLQQNMDWEVDWIEHGEEVRITAIHAEHYDEVWTAKPLFAEIEEAVLGANASFQEELLYGVGECYGRIDRLLSVPYLGMQGLAIGDLDGDGLDDLYVCQHGGLPNRVFLHQADGTARDATASSGAGLLENSRGALIVDWDNDGDQDLIVAVGPAIAVARNEGQGVFEKFRVFRIDTPGDIYSLSAADADGDGDLDVYACRYATDGILTGAPTPYHDANNGNPNAYFRNDGNRFTIATAEVGLDQNNGKFSLASIWDDFDDDGDVDLFVTNDFGRDNLYRNDGGHFTDVGAAAGADDISAGMGASVADFDLDGDQDIYITNMFSSAGQRIVPQQEFMGGENPEVHQHYDRHARGNTLLANRGDGTFEDVTDKAGVAVGGWGWGARFVDFNNDGLEDLFSPDGFLTNPEPADL